MRRVAEPVWKRPAWIAAIVTLIGIFLSVPEVISKYLSNQQAIRLEKEKTEGVRIANLAAMQEMKFKFIDSTLSQTGPERVIMLRFLESMFDEESVKKWAEREVIELEKLAGVEKQLDDARREFSAKERELQGRIEAGTKDTSNLRAELSHLEEIVADKTEEVSALRNRLMTANESSKKLYIYRLVFSEKDVARANEVENWVTIRAFRRIGGTKATQTKIITCPLIDDPCVGTMDSEDAYLIVEALEEVPEIEMYTVEPSNYGSHAVYVPTFCVPAANVDDTIVCGFNDARSLMEQGLLTKEEFLDKYVEQNFPNEFVR